MRRTSDDDLGVLEQRGDDWTLTFTRRLPHPPERVWRAVTETDHLAAWFPDRIEGDFREGAPLRFVTQTGDAFDGEMLVYEPPSVLELRWGTDRIRIEVAPDGDGDGTVLTLRDTFTDLGKAARDGAGWHECLARLDAHLAGAPGPAVDDTWPAVHPRYVDALGPEASTIGPPGG
jgi:uncharacterized protein YndB with AHSA1/START domain